MGDRGGKKDMKKEIIFRKRPNISSREKRVASSGKKKKGPDKKTLRRLQGNVS